MPLASQCCPPPPSPLSLSHLGQKSQPPTGKALRTEFLWRWSRLGALPLPQSGFSVPSYLGPRDVNSCPLVPGSRDLA